jgi:uncharacterized protein
MTESSLFSRAAALLKLSVRQVAGTMRLLDEGNTVPFITRYRQEGTGGLDEEQIRGVQRCVQQLRDVSGQQQKILKSLAELGKLTPELQSAIEAADSLQRLDELYVPYRSKRKTRADEAREMGLEPLAKAIWTGRCGDRDLDRVAGSCIGKHPGLTSLEIVLRGASDLIAAKISEDVAARDLVRKTAWKTGRVAAKLVAKSDEAATFQDYDKFEQPLSRIPPHRILALDRGEARKALKVSVSWDEEFARSRVGAFLDLARHPAREFMIAALADALKRLVDPAIERELRRDLTERAQRHAVEIFSRNLRQLLLQPPLLGATILAIDPGFRTGCKVAVLDPRGDVIAHDVLFLTRPDRLSAARERLVSLMKEHQATVIAIGNGTASRETQEVVSELIETGQIECRYVTVNEAGASIYSASDVGRAEFPDLEATVRGTISIGRRLLDPLSELVKIEPQHLGVGMYQHDVPEKTLVATLDEVVESCVNHVGVELNHASVELLKHVSGLSRATARAIVDHRSRQGPFQSRRELLDVAGIGAATFTQAAGFLRIRDGHEPLDATWIHPESYSMARQLAKRLALDEQSLRSGKASPEVQGKAETFDKDAVAAELQTDSYTLEQVLQSLLRPGRDPREDLPQPLLRAGVLTLDDLHPGLELSGVVTNVVDFGAFVDVGLKNDGLIHISRMSRQFISSPLDVVSVGQTVRVWVENVDQARQRVGLSLLPATD